MILLIASLLLVLGDYLLRRRGQTGIKVIPPIICIIGLFHWLIGRLLYGWLLASQWFYITIWVTNSMAPRKSYLRESRSEGERMAIKLTDGVHTPSAFASPTNS